MKLLLDENLPKRLKEDFPEHEIFTISDMGWNGVKDSQLLALLKENGFHALLTFDKNMRYQQNFKAYLVTVFVLSAKINSYSELTKLSPQVRDYLKKSRLSFGPVAIM
ncbi:DUF5615 family PIN-like protein [Dyadobacter chenhuakuii]|uniref:DUF5615 family PIN-like protein n=1 Tax=Dyadobacter chenhuakuii TaxID=2909339 RepID=A0ABY4XSY7_9BACT|nr:DUF5615 family PIN-like protein [Dyadobacter chenhuakuii]MCF2492511.1 DUF5615 family PIN-like protein [Dyadobacter chenhuakuii]USJ33191.1 DUF5615 family PIN-like protein [Dyadobacter chenhuakuii]